MRIVGVSYYAAKEALNAGLLRENAAVSIVHEPTNTHDSNAHAAYCGLYQLGHVPRFSAKLFRAARVPSPIKACITLVRGAVNVQEIRLRFETGMESPPRRHAINTIRSSASGVYAIVNVFDMRAYIGKAHNMEDRRREHLAALQQGTHFSPRLLADWQEYPQRFAFVVLKPAAPDRLDLEESKLIDLYGTNDSALGYNQGQGFAPGSQSDPSRASTAPRSATTPRSAAGDGARSDPPRGAPFANPYANLAEQASRPSAAANPSTATNRPAPPLLRQRGTPRGGGCLLMLLVVPVFLCAALLCRR